MRFSLEKVKPNVFCKVIEKDNIVFEIIKWMKKNVYTLENNISRG